MKDESLSCLSGYKFNALQAFSCNRDDFYKLLSANIENKKLEADLTENIVKNRKKLKEQKQEMDQAREAYHVELSTKNEQIKAQADEIKAKDELIESKYREINKKIREMGDKDKAFLEKSIEVKEIMLELKEKDMVIRGHQMNEERDRIKMREVEVVHNDLKLKKKELKVKEREMKLMEDSIKLRMAEIPARAPRKPQYHKQVQEESEVEDEPEVEVEDEPEVEEGELESEEAESEESEDSDESRVQEPSLPEITPEKFKKIYDDIIGGEPVLNESYELSLSFNKPSHLELIIALKQYKLPKIKELELDKVPEGNFHINYFLQKCFPESVKSFVFNWINLKVLNLDDYIDSLVCAAPKVIEKFSVGNLKIDDK
jgi:hypothetical protein